MAIDLDPLELPTTTLARKERTHTINMQIPVNGRAAIQVHREIVTMLPNGEVLKTEPASESNVPFAMLFSEVPDDYQIDGKTKAQWYALLSALGDGIATLARHKMNGTGPFTPPPAPEPEQN